MVDIPLSFKKKKKKKKAQLLVCLLYTMGQTAQGQNLHKALAGLANKILVNFKIKSNFT